MQAQIRCQCGKQIAVNEDLAGQIVGCIRCGRKLRVPEATTAPAEPAAAAATAAAAPSPRDSIYWVLALAFLPLAFSLGRPEEPDLKDRIEKTISQLPWTEQQKARTILESDEHTIDDFFAVLPTRKLVGAWLPRNSLLHLVFGLLASGAFAVVILACFAPDSARPRDLVLVGLFTGTLGVGVLLVMHEIPITAAFIYTAMRAAEDPQSEFLLVCAGFTIGVGLVEEFCKALPIFWYFRKHHGITWRLACLWGLASGVGFGVAEGLMYSERYYNGVSDKEIYLVRFASCVALHAIWAASAGITLAANQEVLRQFDSHEPVNPHARTTATFGWGIDTLSSDDFMSWVFTGMAVVRVIVVVMFLHGIYDAALTRHMNWLALITAGVSFAWFAWQIETCRWAEAPPEPTKAEPATPEPTPG